MNNSKLETIQMTALLKAANRKKIEKTARISRKHTEIISHKTYQRTTDENT